MGGEDSDSLGEFSTVFFYKAKQNGFSFPQLGLAHNRILSVLDEDYVLGPTLVLCVEPRAPATVLAQALALTKERFATSFAW